MGGDSGQPWISMYGGKATAWYIGVIDFLQVRRLHARARPPWCAAC
jgi:hypothetical protein